jgi:hypothetical protein
MVIQQLYVLRLGLQLNGKVFAWHLHDPSFDSQHHKKTNNKAHTTLSCY